MQDRDAINSNLTKYTEEGPFFVDIQNVIINRIKGVYALDEIERNSRLAQNFRGSSEMYGALINNPQ